MITSKNKKIKQDPSVKVCVETMVQIKNIASKRQLESEDGRSPTFLSIVRDAVKDLTKKEGVKS